MENKEYISVKAFADRFQISERTARNYCSNGKIAGAFLVGKTWNIPSNVLLPGRKKAFKESVLLKSLREQKQMKLKGGIYHRIQIDLTYNSNHIEGSKLTKEQTRFIFETNTIGVTDDAVNVDDIIETTNHFRCIDYIIDHETNELTEAFIKQLHYLLKSSTSDAAKDWFAVGDYKRLPNEVGGTQTCPPEKVHSQLKELLSSYKSQKEPSFEDLLDLHVCFERIHPFQDGNGRVGRLILFKECLKHSVVPFIITEELKMFYYRGLHQWGKINGYLTDTCLSSQDNFKELMAYFKLKE